MGHERRAGRRPSPIGHRGWPSPPRHRDPRPMDAPVGVLTPDPFRSVGKEWCPHLKHRCLDDMMPAGGGPANRAGRYPWVGRLVAQSPLRGSTRANARRGLPSDQRQGGRPGPHNRGVTDGAGSGHRRRASPPFPSGREGARWDRGHQPLRVRSGLSGERAQLLSGRAAGHPWRS